MPRWTDCLIGIGANQGDRAAAFSGFWRMLTDDRDFRQARPAGIYLTVPMTASAESAAAASFWNSAVAVQTCLEPHALLGRLKRWERKLGRQPTGRWGARAIDLDILLLRGLCVVDATLTIPHRGLAYRRFALDPACEVAGDWLHPSLGVPLDEVRQRLLQRPLPVAWTGMPVGMGEGRAGKSLLNRLRTRFGTAVRLIELAAAERRAASGAVEGERAGDRRRNTCDPAAGDRTPTARRSRRPERPVLVISGCAPTGSAIRTGRPATGTPGEPLSEEPGGDAAERDLLVNGAGDRVLHVAPGLLDPRGEAFLFAVLTAATDEPRRIAGADMWAKR